MKPFRIPLSRITLILVLVVMTFLVGNTHAFTSVRAASFSTPTATAHSQAKIDTTLTSTPVPTLVLVSADTTGIIVLAIVIVVIVLIGTILNGNKTNKKKFP